MLAAHAELTKAFGPEYSVRRGLPVALDDYSEPEPDLAVVKGGPWTYRRRHPAKPRLALEISLTSRSKDRLVKGGLYSRAPSLRFGWKYGGVQLLRRGATVSPLAAPRGRIRVADLLP